MHHPTLENLHSPLPLPDQNVFEFQEQVFSDKRSATKIRPPSPPTKSPPYGRSRIFTTTPSYIQPLSNNINNQNHSNFKQTSKEFLCLYSR